MKNGTRFDLIRYLQQQHTRRLGNWKRDGQTDCYYTWYGSVCYDQQGKCSCYWTGKIL